MTRAIDGTVLWGVVVRAEVRNSLSRGESCTSRQELGRVHLGQGEMNVTRMWLAVAWPRLNEYNKSRYLGHRSGKRRKKIKAREEWRKPFPFFSFHKSLSWAGFAETTDTQGRRS